jgi:hypothetical protein
LQDADRRRLARRNAGHDCTCPGMLDRKGEASCVRPSGDVPDFAPISSLAWRQPPSAGSKPRTPVHLGEETPGAVPVVFAPGVVSAEAGAYGTVVFSPDQTEAIWAADEHPGLFHSLYVDGAWTAPSELRLLPGFRLSSPFFSFDGDRLYFMAAGRDEPGMDTDEGIWVSHRDGDGWTAPEELDQRLNANSMHWQFSLDRAGNLYFCGQGADLYRVEWRGGHFLDPVRLPAPLNTDAPETSPHISADGDLLLFDRWFEAPPYIRIMASFLKPDGSWSEPVDLSPYTKSEGNDSAARLTPDGRYLFFQSVRQGSDPNRSVYWMDAGFLETLRNEARH